MAEVITELRKDEDQGRGTILSHVLPMPTVVPTLTKVRRKAKAAIKKEPTQYTLSLRSHAERERLIADRAASVLNQEPDDPARPPKAVFTHLRPVSDYIREFSEDKRSLWQRSSLQNVPTDDQSEIFYVEALRSVISPTEKKSGYTNILLHVSQLPGRNSSQVKLLDIHGDYSNMFILEQMFFFPLERVHIEHSISFGGIGFCGRRRFLR